jgi:UDP-N-acetylmuramate dehydrogenase
MLKQVDQPPLMVQERVPLARMTTLRIGGSARAFAVAHTAAHVSTALEWGKVHEIPVVPIGKGSNLLVADDGVEGLVVRLDGELAGVSVDGQLLKAGGGASNGMCVLSAYRAGLSGLEFAAGVPGTVGGGIKMNAGAYGQEFKQLLARARVMAPAGTDTWREAVTLGLATRTSAVEDDEIILEVEVLLDPRQPKEIRAKIVSDARERRATQPLRSRTFGSTFVNPDGVGDILAKTAGQMIDACGLKGTRYGEVAISEQHANWIINTGRGRAADVVALMNEVRRRVYCAFGVILRPEVKLLGDITLDAPR